MGVLTDFLSQMQLAALEESPLYEIPKGSVDQLPSGPVRHGPWPAATCAAVLKTWYAAGWIGLYYPEPPSAWNVTPAAWCSRLVDGDVLARSDAEELLDHPERWIPGRADGHACPYQTDAGEAIPWQQWHDQALDIAVRLPLTVPESTH